MNIRAIIGNGRSYKSINPWNPDDTPEAWTPNTSKTDTTKLVPIVFSAWSLRSKALADLPFCIYKGDKEVDNSDDYQNVVKFMPDPYQTFWKWEGALTGYGAFYSFNEHNSSVTKSLYYWKPDTVEVEFNTKEWRPETFIKNTGKTKVKYPAADVLYCWLPDPAVELGLPTMYPLLSALTAASALDSVNKFIADYAGRGMTKMFLLAMKGNPPQAEKDRIQSWWNSFWNKVKVRWMVFNADSITPTVIGDGLEALRGTEVTRNLEQQVLEAMGVPMSLIMADAANYATAQQDVRTFYTNTIVPDARIIQSALNTQILEPMGYHLEFEPQRLECFQTDEAERATALSSLAGTFNTTSPEAILLSMDILGYDLTDDQRKLMEAMIADKKKAREQMDEQLKPKEETAEEDEPDEDEPMREDMQKWMRKALKHIGKDVTFVSDTIPAEISASIHKALPGCKTEDEVRALFAGDVPVKAEPDQAIMALSDSIREAVKVMNTPEAPPPNYTINLTAQMPQPGEPSVNVMVPQQAAPVVNVNVPEQIPVVNVSVDQPAPVVNVTNEVQPAEVVLPKKTKREVKVKRDSSGAVTGLEEK